jgi:pSer/pThr/pTyr-binding forkhead associated (FHA) protein
MLTAFILRIVGGPRDGAEYRTEAPATYVIGREADCDLHLSEGVLTQTLSRHHCRIDAGSQGVIVRDLGSRNGTFLNGTNIGQRPRGHAAADEPTPGPGYQLADGDVLLVGDFKFRVELVSDDAAVDRECRRHAAGVC